jgi:hypothetical protein
VLLWWLALFGWWLVLGTNAGLELIARRVRGALRRTARRCAAPPGAAALPLRGAWSLLVRSAEDVGYGWLPAVLALGSVLTGGTLLRAAARVSSAGVTKPIRCSQPTAALGGGT